MATTQHSLTLPHGTVQYWEYHPGQSPTIVMIHGFRGTHHGLEKIAQELEEYRLIVPDLPGFGTSDPFESKTHSLENYVTFVHEFIAQLGLKGKPVILGHSFGSIVVSHYIAKYPDGADKLVLINPIGAPALRGPRGIMTRLAIGYYWLGRKLPKRSAKTWLGAPPIVKVMSITMAKTKDKATRAYIHDQHRRYFSTFANKHVVAESFRASVSSDVSHVAEQLTLSTLLIAGEKDDITTLGKQHELHARIPSGKLHIIKDTGHLIHYEKPAEAAQAIKNFLQQ